MHVETFGNLKLILFFGVSVISPHPSLVLLSIDVSANQRKASKVGDAF
jgi:hypothetical protein